MLGDKVLGSRSDSVATCEILGMTLSFPGPQFLFL